MVAVLSSVNRPGGALLLTGGRTGGACEASTCARDERGHAISMRGAQAGAEGALGDGTVCCASERHPLAPLDQQRALQGRSIPPPCVSMRM
jgi:hypothetical protein